MSKFFFAFSLILAVTFVSICYSKGDSTTKSESGIQFFNGTWEEALQKSTEEQKPIFLDIYASWCGPCKKLKRNTFTDKEAADYYNANFINLSLDGGKSEGNILARKYKIKGYPSLFIIYESGAIIRSSVGYQSAKQLIHFGKSAIKRYE